MNTFQYFLYIVIVVVFTSKLERAVLRAALRCDSVLPVPMKTAVTLQTTVVGGRAIECLLFLFYLAFEGYNTLHNNAPYTSLTWKSF